MSEASKLLASCRLRGIRLTAAESCTGGLIGAVLTDVPGSSDVFERGFVTYSNQAKTDMLGVPPALIAAHGAVSAEVAAAMAAGALAHAQAQLAVAVTGIAGPGGGSPDKPVGLVYIATAMGATDVQAVRHVFAGDRQAVRGQAVAAALSALMERLK